MRHMKKITSIVMAMMLMFACTGCGSENADYSAGQISEVEQEDTIELSGDITQDEDVVSEESEAVEETEEAVEEGKDLSLGRIQGGIYTNEYIGLACELDSTWEFYTAEELQELPDNIAELMEGTELGEGIDQIQQIMDMQAECVNDMTGINILYQKLSMQERLAYMAIDEQALIELTISQQGDMITESYAQAGIIVEEMSPKTVTFLGEERTVLLTKAKIQEMDYYVLQIFNYDLGQYSATITCSSFVEDKTEELLDLFYAL